MDYPYLAVIRDVLKGLGYLFLLLFIGAFLFALTSSPGMARIIAYGFSAGSLLSGIILLANGEVITLFMDIAEDTYEISQDLKTIARQNANIVLLLQRILESKK